MTACHCTWRTLMFLLAIACHPICHCIEVRSYELKQQKLPEDSGVPATDLSRNGFESGREAIWRPHLPYAYHDPPPNPPDDIWVLRKARISPDFLELPADTTAGSSMAESAGDSSDRQDGPGNIGDGKDTLGGVLHIIAGIPKGYTAATIIGVKKNSAGDIKAFEACLLGNGLMILIILVAFTFFFRSRYPMIYQNNAESGIFPPPPQELGNGYFSWLVASCSISIDEVADHISLDGAMLLEFSHLGMKVMALLGGPLMFIMGPLDAYFGGGAAKKDLLSYPSMSNILPGSWLYWVYMVIVWVVVIVVTEFTWNAKVLFIKRRYKWLEEMHLPRATTILVEGIPEEARSDRDLKAFFARLFGESKVKDAFVVKRLPDLEKAMHAKEEAEKGLHSNKFQLGQMVNNIVESVSSTLEQLKLSKNIDDFTRDLEEAEQAIEKQRAVMEEVTPIAGGVNTGVGFVTFTDRHVREIARHMTYTEDAKQWKLSQPPHPQSVRWDDLKLKPELTTFWMVLGYALLFVLFLAYLPCVLYISVFCSKIKMGLGLESVWEAFAPSAGLTFMVSLLPCALSFIARKFFTMKDEQMHQLLIQNWDFWFQVTYVIMVTAIGTSVADFVKLLATDPFDIFHVLAITLPESTHFYINYLVLQITFQVLNFWRYMNLFRYLTFSRIFEAEVARSLAEPEDQDYWGIGARSTNFVIYFNIGLIFSTLCPLVAWVAFFMFVMLRLTYGYLIPFAETKKSDQGGIFWEGQLQHIFIGLLIYCVLMIGVLFQNAPSNVPGLVCLPTVIYVGWTFHCFRVDFNWVMLPWVEIVENAGKMNEAEDDQRYVQPDVLAVQDVCSICGSYVKVADAPCEKCDSEDREVLSPRPKSSRRRTRSSIYGLFSFDSGTPGSRANTFSIAEDGSEDTEQVCVCGNVFMPDAVFCRKCGKEREASSKPRRDMSSTV